MPEIVAESSDRNVLDEAIKFSVIFHQIGLPLHQIANLFPGEMRGSETVFKPGVIPTAEHQVGHSKLL